MSNIILSEIKTQCIMYFMTYCLYLDPSQIMIKVQVMVHQTMNIANKYF